MKLLLFVGEQLLDSVDVGSGGLSTLHVQVIKESMQALIKKHKHTLTASDLPPRFCLEGVPSRVNGFQSMKDQFSI
jgi:hypothetical protein